MPRLNRIVPPAVQVYSDATEDQMCSDTLKPPFEWPGSACFGSLIVVVSIELSAPAVTSATDPESRHRTEGSHSSINKRADCNGEVYGRNEQTDMGKEFEPQYSPDTHGLLRLSLRYRLSPCHV